MKRFFIAILIVFIGGSLLFSQNIPMTPHSTVTITVSSVTFPSKDSLMITADFYKASPAKAFSLLCHQARFSRGEYRETAPVLVLKGISCLTIDQRSGNEVNDVINATAKLAKEKGLPTDYLSAKQDIEAAIDFAYKKNNKQPILLVGSSYSATLALLIGKDNDKVKAIAVFSPGEYFKNISIAKGIKGLQKPIFVTAAKDEISSVKKLLRYVDSGNITLFSPKVKGFHGSKALWKKNPGSEAYSNAFDSWLERIVL